MHGHPACPQGTAITEVLATRLIRASDDFLVTSIPVWKEYVLPLVNSRTGSFGVVLSAIVVASSPS